MTEREAKLSYIQLEVSSYLLSIENMVYMIMKNVKQNEDDTKYRMEFPMRLLEGLEQIEREYEMGR